MESTTQQYPVPLADIEEQINFELDCTSEGVKRYRRNLEASGVADSKVGRSITADLMTKLIPLIQEKQQEAAAGIAKGNHSQEWWWIIGFLPADALAFLTIRTAMVDKRTWTGGLQLSSMALMIGEATKLEMEFAAWRKDSARRKAEGIDKVDYYQMLTQYHPDVDQRTFRRWKKKLDRIETFDWTRDQRLQVGAVMVHLFAQVAGEFFTVSRLRKRGKTVQLLFVTEEARNYMDTMNDQFGADNPLLMPMLCPPRQWQRAEKGSNDA